MTDATLPDGHAQARLQERFRSYVRLDGECHVWTGGKTRGGYGFFFIRKIHGRSVQQYAHRVAYELAFGPIPAGLFVCHRCDTPACVRPEHLFLGSPTENMRDASRKGRIRNQARLTGDDARTIRVLYRRGGVTQQQIAERFGISFQHVSSIVRGRRWKE